MKRMFANTKIETMHCNSKKIIELENENAIIQTEEIRDNNKNLIIEYVDYANEETIQSLIPFYKNIYQKKVK